MKSSLVLQRFILVLFLVLITVPGIQGVTKILNVRSLFGVIPPKQKVDLSLMSWMDGLYQPYMIEMAKDNIGFRPYLVRLSNQINYSVFDHLTSIYVVRGKQDYLYELAYVENAMGKHLMHADTLKTIARRLSLINEYLKSRSKQMIVIIAPNKARFYPEYLPDESVSFPEVSNYSNVKTYFEGESLPVLDCIEIFEKEKANAKYPLIGKCGSHWSMYGSSVIADTLMSRLQSQSDQLIKTFRIGEIETSDVTRATDGDLNGLANLMFDIPSGTLAYPKLEPKEGGKKLRVLAVGDSYYLSFMHNGLVETCFTPNSLMLYYFSTVYEGCEVSDKKLSDIDFNALLEDVDVVLLCSAEPNTDIAYYEFTKRFEQLILHK